ncbi:hypothetical protein RhiirA4_546821 [Rhizophagus irregularis]|uniref:Uncharacterized protein n=1 Tax=Rhizophagus irregularis TaxID=588596 RepID=A0A2I1GZ30_9GLOM|nr:hypothetical protein RhiirA4_546821 [Rhizophagus irregularis]
MSNKTAYQKILQLAYTEEFLEIFVINLLIAHDKLSVKFKEIAEGSKKLSKFVLHYQFIFKKDKIKNSFSIQSGTSNESNVSLDAIRSKLERKQCVYGTKEKMESLDYSEDKSDSDKSTEADDDDEYEEDDYNETTIQPRIIADLAYFHF